jgi:hypothetical protein
LHRGFLIDRQGDHQPGKVYWSSGDLWSYMIAQETVLPVATYRCHGCGRLESFAVDPALRTQPQPCETGMVREVVDSHLSSVFGGTHAVGPPPTTQVEVEQESDSHDNADRQAIGTCGEHSRAAAAL